jgi:hypothetical protein
MRTNHVVPGPGVGLGVGLGVGVCPGVGVVPRVGLPGLIVPTLVERLVEPRSQPENTKAKLKIIWKLICFDINARALYS